MVKLIPDDHHQALRIRRFSIAFAGYLLLLAMILFLVFFGYMRGRGMLTFGLMAAGLITANMVIYLMFFSGVNQKFKDPSLTIPQLLVGIVFVSLLAYFSPNSVRGIVLLVYILIFVFGTFRLRLREFFLLVAVTEVLYGLSMFCLYQRLPAAVDFKLEFIRAVILAASLL